MPDKYIRNIGGATCEMPGCGRRFSVRRAPDFPVCPECREAAEQHAERMKRAARTQRARQQRQASHA